MGLPDSLIRPVSIFKRDIKEMNMMQKQQGFTLLELLVVITLLAVLSVGALVAYEGVGDNAQATAAANNTVTADAAIRNYRAVTGNYPDQWDNLSAPAAATPFDGAAGTITAAATRSAFGDFALGAATNSGVVWGALEAVGIGAIQEVATITAGIQPNLLHNEGANGTGNSLETDVDSLAHISIVPAGAGCTVGGQSIANNYAGSNPTLPVASAAINKINDHLEGGLCHLVVALGFGHDAAHSTTNSSVALSAAPTYSSKNINPATQYARYVGLFWLGSDNAAAPDNDLDDAGELNATARLIAVVTPEGKTLDESLAAATAAN